jgi:Xaa-Pro dipeptidase
VGGGIEHRAAAGGLAPAVQQRQGDEEAETMLNRRTMLGTGAAVAVAAMLPRGSAAWAAAQEAAELKPFNLPSPIAPAERARRLRGARDLMRRHGIGAVLVEAGPSLDYYTGIQWWRSERLTGVVIPAEGEPIVVTPFFEGPSIREMLAVPAEIRTWQEDEEPLKLVADFLRERRVAGLPIGFEESNRFFLADRLKQQLPGARIVSANPVVRAQRMIKTATELALMQAAADVMIAAFRHTWPRVREGMGPSEIDAIIGAATRALGGSYDGGLVLIGEGTAYPHGTRTPMRVARGANVLLDCGCDVHGYKSDISRTFVFGAEPTAEQRKVWTQMRRGQDIAMAAALSYVRRPAASMTPSAGHMKAGAMARATSCPAPRIAPATASAWRGMSPSTWSMARRLRWRPACAFPTSRESTFPANGASGWRTAFT